MPTSARSIRKPAAVVLMAVMVVGLLTGCLSDSQVQAQSLLNADRTANGLPALADFSAADAKAQAWAEHLASNSSVPPVLSHSDLTDGYEAGTWCHLGENVGAGPSVAALEPAFMASAPHRANILNADYDHVGTGVATNPISGYTFVVQEFVDLC